MQDTVALPHADQVDLADVRRRVKAIFIGSVGNLVEWAVIATSLIVYVTMRDTKHASAMGRHE